jgi:hypothetical protein
MVTPALAEESDGRPEAPVTAPIAPELPPVDCTITGTPRADRLVGTPGDDVICGRGGNDVIHGGGGDDVLVGGGGRDRILGGRGEDVIRGGNASDFLDGGSGRDQLDGGQGTDVLRGGVGTNGCIMDPADSATSGCVSDTTGPDATLVSVPVNVQPGVDFRVSWRVSDPAGVSSTWMWVGGRQGWSGWCVGQEGELVSGDRFDGVYTAICTVSESVINDTFSVFVNAVDMLGNALYLKEIGEFSVVGGSDDLDAPTVTLVSANREVDIGEEWTVTWQASDTSGVAFTYLYLINLSAGRAYPIGLGALISGDIYDGTYEAKFIFQEAMPSGSYELYQWSGDPVNNRSVTSFGSVQALSWSALSNMT